VAVSLVLWDQVAETDRLRRRLGITQPVVELFSTDARLTDLASADWKQLEEEEATGTDGGPSAPVSLRARARTMGGRRRRR
jgi:hypothetical protein